MSQIFENNDTITVMPSQDLVASMSDEFNAELHDLMQKKSMEITIDLTNVKIVDSVGIGVLIAAHNSLKNIQKKLTVTNVAPNIYRLFTTMRLDSHFTVESAE